MPQVIKIWEIDETNKLNEIKKSKLDLEERIENWLESDISVVSNDLLVIGRQVETDFGGIIDLLCIDYNGDLIIIELKRNKTPRDVTAQILDYASWVNNLSNEKVNEIANRYLKETAPLEDAFKKKFNSDFPEILNEHHKMLIVGSEIDSSTERIINYLSDSYGISINAATFEYFVDKNNRELIAMVYLIEPSQVEYKSFTKSSSKRKSALSSDELLEIAEINGVSDIYQYLLKELPNYFNNRKNTMSSVAFIGSMNGSQNTIFSIVPSRSKSEKGLLYQIYTDRFTSYFDINKENIVNFLPSYSKKNDCWAGGFGEGYFRNMEQAEKFINELVTLKSKLDLNCRRQVKKDTLG
jgi:hypothetical protein